jgi:ubiquinone/menaquinone biosynthesis C-methylase UbiE
MDFNSEEGGRRYQETLVPLMFAPSARQLVAKAALPKAAHALDVATGTGVVARAVAAAVGSTGRVVALDMTPGMLAVARSQHAPTTDAPIEYIETAMENASLPAGAFHAIFCQQGLQFFDEPIAALKHMHQALRPDGRIHIALWGTIEEHPLAGSMQRALLECGLDDLTWFLAKAHRLHDAAVVTNMLEQAGFVDVQTEAADISPDSTWHAADAPRLLTATPLAPKLAMLTGEQRTALSDACQRQLRRFAKGDALDLHFAATFYSARVA